MRFLKKTILALPLLAALTGCTTTAESLEAVLERLEFEDDEYGSFELDGTVDINPAPFFSTNVHLKLEKFKLPPESTELPGAISP